jgi:hypothetical protein
MNKFLYVLAAIAFLLALYCSAFRDAITRTLDTDDWLALLLAPCFACAPFVGLRFTFGQERPQPTDQTERVLSYLADSGVDGPQQLYYLGGSLLMALFDLFLLWRTITGK